MYTGNPVAAFVPTFFRSPLPIIDLCNCDGRKGEVRAGKEAKRGKENRRGGEND